MDEKTVELMGAMLRATPEQRTQFWKSLEEYCIANGIEPVFYHPYVPLQIVDGTVDPTTFKFKTRYDDGSMD